MIQAYEEDDVDYGDGELGELGEGEGGAPVAQGEQRNGVEAPEVEEQVNAHGGTVQYEGNAHEVNVPTGGMARNANEGNLQVNAHEGNVPIYGGYAQGYGQNNAALQPRSKYPLLPQHFYRHNTDTCADFGGNGAYPTTAPMQGDTEWSEWRGRCLNCKQLGTW